MSIYTYPTVNLQGPAGPTGPENGPTGPTGSNAGVSYDIGGFVAGQYVPNERILQFTVARSFTFAANFSGSRGNAVSVATTGKSFPVYKNGSQIGSMIFATGSSSATFTTGGNVFSCAPGDYIHVEAPSLADATLANFSFTFRGTLI